MKKIETYHYTSNERIKNQRVWSFLNNYISSENLPSVLIKKVSTDKNFRTLLSKREEWEREYTDYNLKENTVKWYTVDSKTSTGAGNGIYGPRTKCALSLGSRMHLDFTYSRLAPSENSAMPLARRTRTEKPITSNAKRHLFLSHARTYLSISTNPIYDSHYIETARDKLDFYFLILLR